MPKTKKIYLAHYVIVPRGKESKVIIIAGQDQVKVDKKMVEIAKTQNGCEVKEAIFIEVK